MELLWSAAGRQSWQHGIYITLWLSRGLTSTNELILPNNSAFIRVTSNCGHQTRALKQWPRLFLMHDMLSCGHCGVIWGVLCQIQRVGQGTWIWMGAKPVLPSLGNKFVFRVSIFLICKTRRARKLTNMWILCEDLETWGIFCELWHMYRHTVAMGAGGCCIVLRVMVKGQSKNSQTFLADNYL